MTQQSGPAAAQRAQDTKSVHVLPKTGSSTADSSTSYSGATSESGYLRIPAHLWPRHSARVSATAPPDSKIDTSPAAGLRRAVTVDAAATSATATSAPCRSATTSAPAVRRLSNAAPADKAGALPFAALACAPTVCSTAHAAETLAYTAAVQTTAFGAARPPGSRAERAQAAARSYTVPADGVTAAPAKRAHESSTAGPGAAFNARAACNPVGVCPQADEGCALSAEIEARTGHNRLFDANTASVASRKHSQCRNAGKGMYASKGLQNSTGGNGVAARSADGHVASASFSDSELPLHDSAAGFEKRRQFVARLRKEYKCAAPASYMRLELPACSQCMRLGTFCAKSQRLLLELGLPSHCRVVCMCTPTRAISKWSSVQRTTQCSFCFVGRPDKRFERQTQRQDLWRVKQLLERVALCGWRVLRCSLLHIWQVRT